MVLEREMAHPGAKNDKDIPWSTSDVEAGNSVGSVSRQGGRPAGLLLADGEDMKLREAVPLLEEELREPLSPVGSEEPVALLPVNPPSCEKQDKEERASDLESDEASLPSCRICLENEPEDLISPCACKGHSQFVHRSCLDQWRSVKEGFAFAHCTTCRAQFHLKANVPEDMSWRTRKFQLFITRDICAVFVLVQLIVAALALLVALVDYRGHFKESFQGTHSALLFYYCWGVFIFLILFGVAGMVIHCAYYQQLGYHESCTRCCFDCTGCIYFAPECDASACVGGAAGGEFMVVVIVAFAVLGLVYGVIAAMFAWQQIWQRHYHILAKRVLAEEFVVQDMHGAYTPPTLAPEDEQRLKSLNLL